MLSQGGPDPGTGPSRLAARCERSPVVEVAAAPWLSCRISPRQPTGRPPWSPVTTSVPLWCRC